MRSLLATTLALAASAAAVATAHAAPNPAEKGPDIGVSISISQPGVYGRIDIGRFPQPAVVVQQYVHQLAAPSSSVAGHRNGSWLLDEGKRLAPLVGSGGLPTTLFYDARGRLTARHLGVLSSASLAARLKEIATP